MEKILFIEGIVIATNKVILEKYHDFCNSEDFEGQTLDEFMEDQEEELIFWNNMDMWESELSDHELFCNQSGDKLNGILEEAFEDNKDRLEVL